MHVLQTGPKGVINDWREFKRLESERREEQEREKNALAKKLQMTCRSHVRTVFDGLFKAWQDKHLKSYCHAKKKIFWYILMLV